MSLIVSGFDTLKTNSRIGPNGWILTSDPAGSGSRSRPDPMTLGLARSGSGPGSRIHDHGSMKSTRYPASSDPDPVHP